MVDKNLFLYDLAVVTIMKIDGPYVKEWLDYHLLAGVDHFYIYDNESVDEYRDVIKPYVERGIVTSIPTDVWIAGVPAYNDSVKNFRFQSRYIAFIDSDEFIFPKKNRSIVEVLDNLFSNNPNAGTVSVNWQCFGSNGQEKADYTRGVLERFTRRAKDSWYSPPDGARTEWIGNIHVKNISNPRKINFFRSPHFPDCFAGVSTIDDNSKVVSSSFIKLPITINTLVLNHYYTKSHEEFLKRRPASSGQRSKFFPLYDRNEVFDDGIIKYRDARRDALIGKGGGY